MSIVKDDAEIQIMAAYIIAEVEVQDAERYEDYKPMVPPTLAEYGGRFIVRGGAAEALEGEWSPRRVVIMEFPSAEQARAWWGSEAYAPAKELRQATADSRLILVEGV
jgi:uncharacterized protein (DUF1330 family)